MEIALKITNATVEKTTKPKMWKKVIVYFSKHQKKIGLVVLSLAGVKTHQYLGGVPTDKGEVHAKQDPGMMKKSEIFWFIMFGFIF